MKNSLLIILFGGTIVVSGCGDGGGKDPTTQTIPKEKKADYNAYSATLPKWEEFSPLLTSGNIPVEGSKSFKNELIGDTVYQCSTETVDMTSTPSKLVTFNPDMGSLWVGSLLQGKHYLGGLGSLAELPIRERAPITIYIDKFGQQVSKKIENPTAASVQQAISDLVNQIDASKNPVSSSIYLQFASAHSAEQTAMSLGISAKYAGAKLSTSFANKQAVDENRVNANFVQELFTVTVVSPQTPASLFSNDFTEAKLQEQTKLGRLGKDNVPVYVAAITYGRILNYTMTAKAAENEMKMIANASYAGLTGNGGGVSLTNEQKKILNESKIEVIALGGDQENALKLIRSGDLREYFEKNSSLSSAKPISYEIHNLADDTNALFSETTRYNLQSCNNGNTQILKKSLRESATTKSGVFDGGERRESIKSDKYTLPKNSYFMENKEKITYILQGGSENECKVSYSDYYDIPLSDGGIKKVPSTVNYSARIRSPKGWGASGTIECSFEFSYINR